MNITKEVHGDLLIIDIKEDRIDAAAAVTFKESMREYVAGHDGRVLIDMKQVEFLDSSGLGALVAVMKLLNGRSLELAEAGDVVRKVLSLTRMDRIFIMHASRSDALADRDAA